MAVYDKELIINGEAVRSPEQQVYKNMQDIKALKEKIKNTYSTTDTTLTSSSVSVATANVDGLGTATEGWLLDPNGLLFKITANDGTTTTLQYYSDLKGPQGQDGAAVNIDDNITSATKVWSSLKTSNEITGLIDDSTPSATKVWSSSKVSSLLSDGIYWTSSEPTLVGSEYQISGDIYCGADIINPSGTPGLTDNVLKAGDMIAYVDNDGKISSIWYYISGSSPKVVAKVGDIGGGKQLYQHNIMLQGQISGNYVRGTFTIICDSDLPFVKSNDYVVGTNQNLMAWLENKGFIGTGLTDVYTANIYAYDNAPYQGIGSQNDYFYTIANQTLARLQITGSSITDTVISI